VQFVEVCDEAFEHPSSDIPEVVGILEESRPFIPYIGNHAVIPA
jgi:hypothetical protein